MSTRQLIGVFLLSLPFVVITAAMACDIGWRGALAVWGAVLGIAGCIAGGVYLLLYL